MSLFSILDKWGGHYSGDPSADLAYERGEGSQRTCTTTPATAIQHPRGGVRVPALLSEMCARTEQS